MKKIFLIVLSSIFIFGCNNNSDVQQSNQLIENLKKENDSLKKDNEKLKTELTKINNKKNTKSVDIEENIEEDANIKNPSTEQVNNDVKKKFALNTKMEILSIKEVDRKEMNAGWLYVYCEAKIKSKGRPVDNIYNIPEGISMADVTLKYQRIGANYKCDFGMSDIAKR